MSVGKVTSGVLPGGAYDSAGKQVVITREQRVAQVVEGADQIIQAIDQGGVDFGGAAKNAIVRNLARGLRFLAKGELTE